MTRSQWATGVRRLVRSLANRDASAVAMLGRSAVSALFQAPTAQRLFKDLDRLRSGVIAAPERPTISPLVDVPFPRVDLDRAGELLSAILKAPEFGQCVEFFSKFDSAPRALVSPNTQALLHTLVRNQGGDDVVEIGTYRASTTEALARAVLANGRGKVHTVDPFGADVVPKVLAGWPNQLRDRVAFYPEDSMQFFAAATKRSLRPGLVFVDGNHDYEFALFDIEAAARIVRPGGYIAIDNINQAGPFFAMCDFLDRHESWSELGGCRANLRLAYPFDRERTAIENTDLGLLSAPTRFAVGQRPVTTGEQVWQGSAGLSGITVSVPRSVKGALYVQCVLRSFGNPPTEETIEGRARFEDSGGEITIHLPGGWGGSSALRRTVEPWLVWEGEGEVELAGEPRLC